MGTATEGTKELMKLFDGEKLFDTPKPVRLLTEILKLSSKTDSIILDFFAGSGTTAQAVMELNLEDGGNRQCICVQLPEVLEENSEAYKAGYRTIADITRARIDKVIAKLKAEHPEKTANLACAHFTLAPSNFKIWRTDLSDAEALREQLALFQQVEKNVSPSTTDVQTAMLTELLLKNGLGALGVHAMAEPRHVAGLTVHQVLMADDKTLWLCFDTYQEALKDEIVKAMPAQVVMLNSCFAGDKADEQLANLQLELAGLDIGLTLI
jgi:adenine-specific DNA-methyltransferase